MALSARAADNFAVYVEPVFKQHCYRCHSHAAGIMKGGLTLDSRSGWAQGGDSGPAVVPGKPSESLLLKAIKHLPGVKAMPPQKTISAAEVAAIETWILQGAP
jgi:mono/diheme cytochrome c family protein